MSDPAGPFSSLHLELSSTVDRVADELRRAVFDGELESGTPLREVALAESLGVSRPTIREALGTLVAEGLATREPNRGVAVSAPDPDSVRDICRSRLVLEGAGVRRWPGADEPLRDAVRTSLVDYTGAVRTGGSYQELNGRHLAFHVSLVGLTGSPRLVAMAESLMIELRLALAQVDRIRRNAHDQADTHTQLVMLLERGDVDGASAFLERHLEDAETSILQALGLRRL
ncbi:GntR family transcriptional regulator [Nocardioides sp. YIM 152315]|uniref:GntR family transcriptional regulator n=1 Tax=Nocardioides sp. YIM 152315 TaxID=3031760 RepID=UPI0023DC3C22|nr:GntR family transcriptional regulator [Nocardioides sp. YIM 152315]MDF1604284.1 GntR family transcriptional regulator [Nocardioides sp. YIM 152315]